MKPSIVSRALRVGIAACGLLLSLGAHAHEYTLGALHIAHPHARPTAPGQPTGGGYFAITNRGSTPDRLVGAAAPSVAQSVEVHEMRMVGDVMRMREVGAIDLPPGKTVALEPGGFHLMIMGLKAPLASGQRFPLTLTFEKAGKIEVEMTVDRPGGAASAPMDHAGAKH